MTTQRNARICFVLPVPLLPLKGASFTCYRQAVALEELGFGVSILSARIQDRKGLEGLAKGSIRILDRLPARTERKWSGHFRMLACSWPEIASVIRHEKPDILHVHNPTDILPMVTSVVNRFTRVPLVFQMNDPGPESIVSMSGLTSPRKDVMLLAARLMEKIVMNRADAFATVNDVLRRQIIATRKPIGGKPFITYYNVANLPAEDDAPIAQSGRDVLYVGNLSSEFLGLEPLIRSFRDIWKAYGARLVIVGDGPLLEPLKRIVHAANAEAFVNLTGYVPPQAVPAYIRTAGVCMIPYLDTPLTRVSTPTKLFEYLACGKPVVCPDFPGFVEILGPENPGLYQPTVPDDWHRVLRRLLGDENLRAETGARNKALSSRYTFEGELLKMLNLYETVCSGFGAGPRVRT